MQQNGGHMKLFFHKLLPALLSAGILTLSFPCSVRGAIAPRDWKRGYTGSFTLAWDPLVPGTSHNAVFMMEQGSKVYLGDLATTGICGLSARQLQKEFYESASPRYVSVSKITGLVQGKKPGASLVKLQAADQTITAMITVVPKRTCGLTAEGRKLNTTLFQYGKSFSGKISPSSAIRWYQKAAKAENTLENLSSQQVNPLGFHSSGLLVFPGASSARALTNTLTTYRDNSHPLRRDSCCSFLPESLCANVKKNRLTLRLNSSVTKQQLLGLMTDPLAGLLGQWAADITVGSVLLRIFLSLLMGAFIGWERSSKRHSAGLRTFMLTFLIGTLAAIADSCIFIASGRHGHFLLSAGVVIGAAIIAVHSVF